MQFIGSADVRIEPWSAVAEPRVAAFVNAHDEGLIYYMPCFRRLLLSMLDCACLYRVAWRGEHVTGVLPLVAQDGPFGVILNSLPFFGSNGGVLASDAESEAALRNEYQRLTAVAGVIAATWISHPFAESAAVPVHQYGDERIAQWTVLPEVARREAVLALIDGSARRNVAKAKRSGVTVRETPDALDFLQDVHRRNMQAIGGRAKPAAFFDRLPQAMQFGRDWSLYVAEADGRPIAALLLFYGAKTAEYVMPVVEEDARELQPTATVLATAMTDAVARGMQRWNWGGTWLTQENVYRFKRKWGAKEKRYHYFITLNDVSLLTHSAAELVDAYPNFFTVPYGLLADKRYV
jgi:hypothetical protein